MSVPSEPLDPIAETLLGLLVLHGADEDTINALRTLRQQRDEARRKLAEMTKMTYDMYLQQLDLEDGESVTVTRRGDLYEVSPKRTILAEVLTPKGTP